MDKNYFCFLLEWAEMFNLLTEEQCGQLIKAMIAYEKDGTEPTFSDDILRFAWLSNIKPKMDTIQEHYKEKVDKLSKAGKASAEKRKQKQQMSTNVENVEHSEHLPTNNNYNYNYNLNKKEKPNKKEKDEKNQEGWEDVFEAYEQRFPMTMSSYRAQQLKDIITNYGKEAVLYAIREASTGNAKQPIAYIRSVAMNYSRQKENNQKSEPMKDSPEEIGRKIQEATDRAIAQGEATTFDEMKKQVLENMRRKGMKIVGEGIAT